MTNRLSPEKRAADLLHVAVQVAEAHGLGGLTREAIALHAGVSPALVTARLGTMAELRRSVMRQAVRLRCVAVVAEGLARRDPHALKADADLKELCGAWVAK